MIIYTPVGMTGARSELEFTGGRFQMTEMNRGSSLVSRKGHTTFLLLPLTSGGSGNSGILHSSWGTGGKRYQWGWGIEDGTKEEL